MTDAQLALLRRYLAVDEDGRVLAPRLYLKIGRGVWGPSPSPCGTMPPCRAVGYDELRALRRW